MAELHPPPPDPPTNGGGAHDSLALLPSSSPTATTTTATTAAKRQRRPSVRLGDIGDQPAALPPSDPFLRRPKLQLFPHPSSSSKNHSRNLEALAEFPDDDKDENIETLTSSFRKRNRDSIFRRGWRFASAWTSNPDSGGDDAGDEGFRSEFDDLRREDPSPRVRASEGDAPSESNGWDEEGGVRPWLNRLGLGRYAPVFEIHEVDDEVLPMLTLEDLKDMGINAIGSRRKMFSAIQKLKKNFT